MTECGLRASPMPSCNSSVEVATPRPLPLKPNLAICVAPQCGTRGPALSIYKKKMRSSRLDTSTRIPTFEGDPTAPSNCRKIGGPQVSCPPAGR